MRKFSKAIALMLAFVLFVGSVCSCGLTDSVVPDNSDGTTNDSGNNGTTTKVIIMTEQMMIPAITEKKTQILLTRLPHLIHMFPVRNMISLFMVTLRLLLLLLLLQAVRAQRLLLLLLISSLAVCLQVVSLKPTLVTQMLLAVCPESSL